MKKFWLIILNALLAAACGPHNGVDDRGNPDLKLKLSTIEVSSASYSLPPILRGGAFGLRVCASEIVFSNGESLDLRAPTDPVYVLPKHYIEINQAGTKWGDITPPQGEFSYIHVALGNLDECHFLAVQLVNLHGTFVAKGHPVLTFKGKYQEQESNGVVFDFQPYINALINVTRADQIYPILELNSEFHLY